MSHNETNKIRQSIVVGIVFSIVLSSTAEAVRCETYFKPGFISQVISQLARLNPARFLSKKPKLELTQNQIMDLEDFILSDAFKRPYGFGRNLNDPVFLHFFSQLSPAKKEVLIFIFNNITMNPKKIRQEFTEILEAHNIKFPDSSTMMEMLISSWHEYLNFNEQPVVFSKWLEQKNEIYLQKIRLGELSPAELDHLFQFGLKQKNASDNWINKHGVITMQVKFENGSNWVQVKGTWLKCSINEKSSSIRILVPREMVGRAAWNPIYSEVLQKKIADGTKSPNQYPAFIAGNGVFYLSDGNHRFILDSRKEVWVEMSYPVRTSTFSISLDAIGIAQPSIEKLLQFESKEIDLSGLIGAENAKRFIYF